jgi:hypothetical protein
MLGRSANRILWTFRHRLVLVRTRLVQTHAAIRTKVGLRLESGYGEGHDHLPQTRRAPWALDPLQRQYRAAKHEEAEDIENGGFRPRAYGCGDDDPAPDADCHAPPSAALDVVTNSLVHRSAGIRLGEAESAVRTGGNKSEGDAGDLFGEASLAAWAPYSRLEHKSDAGELSFEMLPESHKAQGSGNVVEQHRFSARAGYSRDSPIVIGSESYPEGHAGQIRIALCAAQISDAWGTAGKN